MTIAVEERIEGATAKLGRDRQATYTRAFNVISSTNKLRPGAAITAVGIVIGDLYHVLDPDDGVTVLDTDAGAFAQEISAALAGSSDDSAQFEVTVTYGPAGGEAGTFPPNPIEHPLKLSWGSALYDEATLVDRAGVAIVNSAGDAPTNTPAIDKYRIVLKIIRNEATFSPTLAQTWKGTVNDDVFAIAGENFAAGTVKISDITAELAYNGEIGWYWPVNYDFEINPEGWKYKFLDEGMRTRDATTDKLKAAVDELGQPVSTDILLDGAGEALAFGVDPVINEVDLLPESDFSLLAFDFTDAPGY